MNVYKVFLLSICLILFSLRLTLGQSVNDYRSNNINGNWNTASHWQVYNGTSWETASNPPTSSANIITIRTGYPMTVNTNVTADQIVVETKAMLTIANGSLTLDNGRAMDLNVYGVVAVIGANSGINIDEGAVINFAAGSIYRHARDGGCIPLANWDLGSTCLVQGTINNLPSQISQEFGNLTWDCPLQTQNSQLDGVISIPGDLTILNTGTGSFTFKYDMENMVGGNYTQSGGYVSFGNNNTHSLNINGDFKLCGGTFLNTGANSPGGVINVSGDFTFTGGNLNGFNLLNIYFNGLSKQTFKSGGIALGVINYTVNNGSFLQMASENTVVTGSTFTLSSGATLGIKSNNGISLSGATGNIQVSGLRTFNANGNYIYNGNYEQITGNGLPTSAITGFISVLNTAGVVPTNNIVTDGTLIVDGVLKPAAGQTINGNGYLTGSGTVQVTRATQGSANFNSQYTIANKTLAYLTVEYKGASAQTVNSINYGSLKINNTSGVILESGSIAINGALTLTSGNLSLGSNTIALNGPTIQSNGNITGGSTTNIIIGGTGPSFTFPGISGGLNNLTINRASGISLSGNLNIIGFLTLTNGKIKLGNNNITVAGSVIGGSSSSYIVTDGTGTLTRNAIGNGANYLFPVGTLTSYNPVTVNNSGTTDNFSARVKSTFDNVPSDTSRAVKRQWTVSEETPGGSNVILTFQFNSGEWGSSFSPSSPVTIGKWNGTSWSSYSATLAGTGPYSISNNSSLPVTSFSSFVVGNDGVTSEGLIGSNNIPGNYKLHQNYPNPFNPETSIQFDIPKAGFVTLKVYDITGKEVMTGVNQYLKAGYYNFKLNASSLTSGVYFYRFISNDFTETRKMILIK